MIHIIDYGLGNVQAFENMYKRLGFEVTRAKSADNLENAKKLILPGVGAFDHAIDLLNASGMRDTLENLVIAKKAPVLGICVGMQILANSSDEGMREGLGWIPGKVHSFNSHELGNNYPLPHMGWNDVIPSNGSPLFKGMEEKSRFYYLHSFYFECESTGHSAAKSSYGIEFDAAVQNNNIFGVQFHPEKSHHWGAQLLKNFAEL